MILFTKPGCTKCEELKSRLDLAGLRFREVVLTGDDPAALAELAYRGAVELAERELPILAVAGELISGAIPIRKWLEGR